MIEKAITKNQVNRSFFFFFFFFWTTKEERWEPSISPWSHLQTTKQRERPVDISRSSSKLL
jgi:hypothetical protein